MPLVLGRLKVHSQCLQVRQVLKGKTPGAGRKVGVDINLARRSPCRCPFDILIHALRGHVGPERIDPERIGRLPVPPVTAADRDTQVLHGLKPGVVRDQTPEVEVAVRVLKPELLRE